MLTLNREELAWAAGFYDGEGYAGAVLGTNGKTNRPTVRIQMSVTQYEPTTLDRFHAAVGGIGTISMAWRNNPQHRGMRWQSQSFESVQAVVALLWPWLSEPKRRQASVALVSYRRERDRLGIRSWRRKAV